MKALRKTAPGKGNVDLLEVAIPTIGPRDVLVRISFCGVCGSDLHIQDGVHPCDPPVTIGHEFSGVVAEVGSEVTDFRPGDNVAMRSGWSPFPGVSGDGGFAEYVRAPAGSMWKTPAGVSQEEASQFETIATPMRLVREEACVEPGETVVVSGVGAIGLMTVAVAKQAGARVISLGTERDVPVRLPLATHMGAEETLVFGDETVAELTDRAPRAWIDASGAAAAIEAAVRCVDRGGTVVVAGLGQGPWNIDMARATYNNITIKGTWGGHTEYIPEAADLMASGAVDLTPLFNTMPLSAWREAFDALRNQRFIKTLLYPD